MVSPGDRVISRGNELSYVEIDAPSAWELVPPSSPSFEFSAIRQLLELLHVILETIEASDIILQEIC